MIFGLTVHECASTWRSDRGQRLVAEAWGRVLQRLVASNHVAHEIPRVAGSSDVQACSSCPTIEWEGSRGKGGQPRLRFGGSASSGAATQQGLFLLTSPDGQQAVGCGLVALIGTVSQGALREWSGLGLGV